MNILVTGGAGFIGSHLVDALLERGHKVRVIDSLDPQVHEAPDVPPTYLNSAAEFQKGDIRNLSDVEKALKGIEVVFHQAAAVGVGQSMYMVRHYMDVNTIGTATLLEEMIKRRTQFKKLIVASSMSIYGEGCYRKKDGSEVSPKIRSYDQFKKGLWELMDSETGEELIPIPTDEEKKLIPVSPYATSKRDQEELCLAIGRAYGIPTVALRYFNVYGERQALSNPYTGVAAIFITRLLNNKSPLIFEDGLQSRDFVHVSDIVQANLMALELDSLDYDYFNVGTGCRLTVLDVANALIKAMGKNISPTIVHKFREGDIRHCFSNINKIQKVTAYSPKVSFEQGIPMLVEWCRGKQAKDRVEKATNELDSKGLTK